MTVTEEGEGAREKVRGGGKSSTPVELESGAVLVRGRGGMDKCLWAAGATTPWAVKLRGERRRERRGDEAVVCKMLEERSRLERRERSALVKRFRKTEACMRSCWPDTVRVRVCQITKYSGGGG